MAIIPAISLLQLLSSSPSTKVITNHQPQGGRPRFFSLSLSPASLVIVKNGQTTRHVRLLIDDGALFQRRTCGRLFATFQALGGHQTSHKRPLVCSPTASTSGSARAPAVLRHGVPDGAGQALGGHMRRHRGDLDFHKLALETMIMM